MKPRNVLLTGGDGQLGMSIISRFNGFNGLKITSSDIGSLDISDPATTGEVIQDIKPDVVVNCAAYTAVDRAETDSEKARAVNSAGPANLAFNCKLRNIPLIHISTDYVFSGESGKPYAEDDPTGPLTVYGKTKLEGENAVISSGAKGIIIRTSWLYSEFGDNFVKNMIRLGGIKSEIGVVNDQFGSPTYAADLAMAILNIIMKYGDYLDSQEPAEIFHYCNSGICTWKDLAAGVMEDYGLNCSVMPVSTAQFPRPAPRPRYSVLDTSKIRTKFKLEIPEWRDSLKKCIDTIKNQK